MCFYELKAGVRQGGVLSPILFGIYIDGLVKLVDKSNTGCKIGVLCTAIFLYADDIILLAPSIQVLQSLIRVCELELNFICMTVNAKKSDRALLKYSVPSPKTRTKISANTLAYGLWRSRFLLTRVNLI